MNKNETNKAELIDVSADELRTVEGGSLLRSVIDSIVKAVNEEHICRPRCVGA